MLVCAGCSSPHKLVVHNELGKSVRVELTWTEGKKQRSKAWELGPGEQDKKLVWFYEAPSEFEVTVTGPSKVSRVFTSKDYPAAMRSKSSMGPTCHLTLSPSGWQLSGPTAADKLDANAPALIIGGLCCGLPIIIGIGCGIWLAVSTSTKRRIRH